MASKLVQTVEALTSNAWRINNKMYRERLLKEVERSKANRDWIGDHES
ncbi:MAG: hypothetical protein ACK2TU_08420 [Anaerolineales bacterium]